MTKGKIMELVNVDVTVLIPVYNTRKYIFRCLESILTQGIDNIEIIIIDDCSTDGTYEMLVEIANRYPFVRLYRNEINRGAGYTKNRALSYAKGEYICFVDSDDWLIEGALQYLLNLAKKTNAEDIYYNSISIYEGRDDVTLPCCFNEQNEETFCSGIDLLEQLLDQGNLSVGAVHHFFRRDKLREEVRFSENTVNDDCNFSINLMASLGKTIYTCQELYIYFRRVNNSITNIYNSKSMIFELFQIAVKLIEQTFDFDSIDEKRVREKVFCYLMIEIQIEREKQKKNAKKEFEAIRKELCQNQRWEKLFESCMKKSKYGMVSEKTIAELKRFEAIYIYGAGQFGYDFGHVIKGYGLPFSGYVVTQKREQDADDVKQIDEIDANTQPAFVIGVSKLYRNEVQNELRKRGFQNVFDLLI